MPHIDLKLDISFGCMRFFIDGYDTTKRGNNDVNYTEISQKLKLPDQVLLFLYMSRALGTFYLIVNFKIVPGKNSWAGHVR